MNGLSYNWYSSESAGTTWEAFNRSRQVVNAINTGARTAAERLSACMSEQTQSIVGSVEDLEASISAKLSSISGQFANVDSAIREVTATLSWGFHELLASMGGMRTTLVDLLKTAKTPAQTAAYEQFDIARDAFRRHLYPECLEALTNAIQGVPGITLGYKLEWRFHYLKGLALLGSHEPESLVVMNPAMAEESFLLAAKYARIDFPRDAARACLSASWAAYVQMPLDSAKLKTALSYVIDAAKLDPDLTEALFQYAKLEMANGRPTVALPLLKTAIERETAYCAKAAADGDFKRFDGELQKFLLDLRNETQTVLETRVRVELAAIDRQPDLWAKSLRATELIAAWQSLLDRPAAWTLVALLECARNLGTQVQQVSQYLSRIDEVKSAALDAYNALDGYAPADARTMVFWSDLASDRAVLRIADLPSFLKTTLPNEKAALIAQYKCTLDLWHSSINYSEEHSYSIVEYRGQTHECRDLFKRRELRLFIPKGNVVLKIRQQSDRHRLSGTLSINVSAATAYAWLPHLHPDGRCENPSAMNGCDIVSFEIEQEPNTVGKIAAGSNSSGCFPPSAEVLTSSGVRPISSLVAGELVISLDRHGHPRSRPVTKVLRHPVAELLCLFVDGGKTLVLTPNHPVRTERGWRPACKLTMGDRVQSHSGRYITIRKVERHGRAPVYNLYTKGEHTFVVDGIVVHNFAVLRRLRTLLHRIFFDVLSKFPRTKPEVVLSPVARGHR